MDDDPQVKTKTLGAVCTMEGGTVRFPQEFIDIIGGTVLVVVNHEGRGLRVRSFKGPSVWHIAVNILAEGFSDFSKLIVPSTAGLDLLLASEKCEDGQCTWEGYFSAPDGGEIKTDVIKEKLITSFEGSAVEINKLDEKDRLDSPLSTAMIEKTTDDGVLDLSRLEIDFADEGKKKVLAVLLSDISQSILLQVSNEKIVHAAVFLENRPEIFAKMVMKLSDKGALPVFTTGMCEEGNLCTWEGYIEVEKTKVYVEGKSKTEAVKEELTAALGGLEGIREVKYQDLRV